MEGIFRSTIALFLIAHLFYLSAAAAAATAAPNSFILTSCRPTSYPTICMQSLAAYASMVRRSPRQLAHAALTVSATRARDASAYVSRLSSGTGRNSAHPQVVSPYQDCITTMSDSANRLQQSIREFRRLGRAGRRSFALRLGTVQTRVSAALTDQSMCLLSLTQDQQNGAKSSSSGRLHAAMKKKVVEVSQFTSNALALVNQLGSRN